MSEPSEMTIRIRSNILSHPVFAIIFQCSAAGMVKANGEQNTAPIKEMNTSS
jgi:hypothetical protein